jgi:hypothetical protein
MIGQVKNGNIIAQKAKNTKKSMINSNYISNHVPELKKMDKLQYEPRKQTEACKTFAKQSPYTVPVRHAQTMNAASSLHFW